MIIHGMFKFFYLSLIHEYVKNIFNVPQNHESFGKFAHNVIARSKATWQSGEVVARAQPAAIS